MEGTAEENSSEAPHIKGKEDVQVQQQSDNRITLQNTAPVIAGDIGWTEHFASIGSPEMLLEALAGKGINFGSGAHPLVQPPTTSSCPSNFPVNKMEGLTAKSVNSTILCRNFCSGSVEDSPVRKGFWENLTRIAGGSRSASAHNESARVDVRKKVAGTLMSQSSIKRPPAFGQFGLYFRKTHDNVVEDDRILSSNTVAQYSPGFVTKDSPALGSGRYVVESNLKGKEAACEDHGTDNIHGQITQSQTNVGTDDNMVKKFESLHNPFIKTDEKILFGDTFDHTDSNAHVDWISLREWIKQKTGQLQQT
ncbi:hypothetical protein HPP92_007626 [Vanilla planifolia]|uniref:Uncharacterized protein n=1 Tax=Vanilla planifolia TaxID=51239 RepID=A0A835V9L2_VANPL|nr:hypothetical protein HPP92_007626 [Vanilla planifolia]